MKRRALGFTLLELTVVVAIFALVSVVAMQALRGSIRSQTGLESASAQNTVIARLITRLRHDLEAGVPLAFLDPQGTERAALEISPGGTGFGLSLGGQARLPDQDGDAGLHRVEWAFDQGSGVLIRRQWLSLIPAQTATPGPNVTQLTDVSAVEVTAFDEEDRWRPDWKPEPGQGLATLPRAMRIRIESAAGTFDLIERF